MNGSDNLHFAIKLDNEALKKDAKESQNIIKGVADEAVVEGEKIEKSFNRVGGAVAALFTAQQASKFIRSMVQIRGEFQQLEIAFTTMLKSGEKANKLMADLTKFAGETPFGLQSSANAARQLIAYGSAAETVIDELRMLGDVAAGTGQQIGDLVYLYGTLRTQGRAFTQDIRQFAGRGIPIYDELSKVMGVAKNEVNDLVTAGKIGFAEVEQAFKNMASSSGMYGGLMEKQSKSVTGRIEELTDAVDVMFNEIGKSSESIVYRIVSGAANLVENYEKVGRIIAGLITTYGAYRAAIITVTVAEKGWTIASMAQYKWLVLVEKAQKLLNATMLKNPYVAITTAVVALVSSLTIFKDRTSDAEKAQERLNETLEKAKNRKEALRIKGNDLIAVLNSETASVYQQVKAYKELVSMLPGLKGKSIEEIQSMDPKDLGKMLSEKSDQTEIDTLQAQYDERIKNIEGYRKQIKKLTSEGADDSTISYYREQLGIALEETKGLKSQLDEIAKIQKEAFYQENPEARRKDLQSQRVTLLEKEKNLIEQINAAGDNDLASANQRLQLEAVRSLLNENQSIIDTLNKSTDKTIKKNKEYWQGVLDQASSARDQLGIDEVGSDEWNRLTHQISNASKQLEHYSNKIKEVAQESKQLAPRDVGSVQSIGKNIIEDFITSSMIDDVTAKQMGEYAQKLRENISGIELEGVDIFDVLTSELWRDAFSNLDKMAVDDMINLIRQLELHWKNLNLDPTEFEALRNQIERITDEIGKRNPFKGLSEAIRAFNSGEGNFKDIAKNAGASLDQVASMFDSVTEGLVKMGIAGDEETQKMLNGIGEMIGGAAELAQGIATGNPAAIVAGGVKLLTSAVQVFDGKTREANRTIERNQKILNKLEGAYKDLAKAINNAYSTEAANLIRKSEEVLQKQKVIIQQQLEAEKSKKKADQEAIQRYEDAISQIEDELEETEARIVEAIFGVSIQSAIDQFAQAYADAFIAGEDAAEASAEVVKNLLKNALMQALKEDIKTLVTDWMNLYTEFISDGIIDSYEQSRLDSLEYEMNRIALKHKKGFDRFVEKEEEEEPEERQGAKKGFATASQNSIDELNGRFTALQQTTSYIKLDTGEIVGGMKMLKELSTRALTHLSSIDKKATNLGALQDIKSDIQSMKTGIDDMNLKGVRIR